MNKNTLTEKQTDIDADMSYFRSKLEQAKLENNEAAISRLEKQIDLLEDAVIIHRINCAPERRIFQTDLGDCSLNEVKAAFEEIKNSMKEKESNE